MPKPGMTHKAPCPRSNSVLSCSESCGSCHRFSKRGHERLFTYAQGTNTGASIRADWVVAE